MTHSLYSSVLLWSSILAVCCRIATACTAMSGDQITGRDVALAVPQLASIAPDLKLGYSPAPGIERVFRASQLQQLALKYGLNTKIIEPACFAWSLHALSQQEITAAIRKALPGREVDLEIIDQSHAAVPAGEVIFPFQGLSSSSDGTAVWSGYVTYTESRRFNTWVRVRVTVHEQHIIATRPIHSEEMIDSSALKAVDYRGPLGRLTALQTEDAVVGKCARWPIAAGVVLSDSMLTLPHDVEREQLVTVRIVCGAAHIETQGVAADAGYRGEIIHVRNVKTGRVFRARIEDRGLVSVVAGGYVGLVVEDKKS